MIDPAHCSHETRRTHHNRWYDIYYGEWHDDIEEITESTFEDIGIHRCMCTQCGKIQYYSERARKFFEDGEGSLP